MAQPPTTCRVSATTIIAATTKTPVATIERGDNRAMPQMPWPDVQPLLSLVPKPTKRPATAMMATLGHLRNGQRVADQRGGKRRRDEADDEGRAPAPLRALRFDQAGKNAGYAGDAAVETHQQ
jgi:hypothetical protein